MVGITEQVSVVESAVSCEPLRVDREPPALAEIEDVAVVGVPMQHRDLSLAGEKIAGRPSRNSQDAALGRSGRLQLLEPLRQRDEIRHRFGSRSMQLHNNRADDSACLIVAAALHEIGKRSFAFCAFQ
jgi:hypothetical protein